MGCGYSRGSSIFSPPVQQRKDEEEKTTSTDLIIFSSAIILPLFLVWLCNCIFRRIFS
jgi:hypothetical protein